jgi:hypothetical protein
MGRPAREGKQTAAPVRWPERTEPNFLILAALTALFFYKVLLHPDQMFWANDIVRAHSEYRQVQWQSIWTWGSFPVWDPTIYCGKSIVGDSLPAVLNPPGWIFWLIPSPILFGYFLWVHVTAGAWGMFLLVRKLGGTALGACLAGIAFALSGKVAGHTFAGHVEVLCVILAMPWLLWAACRIFERPSFANAVLLGALLAFVSTYGSIQALYLNVLFLVLFVLLRLTLDSKTSPFRVRAKVMGVFAISSLVYAAIGAVWWFPVARQALTLTARAESSDYAFATMNSLAYQDLLRLVWPFNRVPEPGPFVSDPALAFFWESATFPGLVAVTIVIASLFVKGVPRLWWILLGLAVFAFLLALGDNSPVHWLAYQIVPGFSLFRAPGRILFYAVFFIALLAGLAVSRDFGKRRWLPVAVAGVGVQAAFLALLGLPDTLLDPAFGAWVPLISLGAISSLAFLWWTGSVTHQVWQIGCVSILAVELFLAWRPHMHTVDPRVAMISSPVANYLESCLDGEDGEFRIYDHTNSIRQETAARLGLEMITGYHPGIYATHLDMYRAIWHEDRSDIVELMLHSSRHVACQNLLNVMNVRYVVSEEIGYPPGYTMVYETDPSAPYGKRFVFKREGALPRAFLVGRAETPPDGDTVLEHLCSIDPREACVVESDPVEGDAAYQGLAIVRDSPSSFRLQFTADAAGVVVVSQAWHPDWRATRNNEPVSIRRVNHGQMGIPVPTGSHSIEVWYHPWDFYWAGGVSLAAIVVVVGLLAAQRLTLKMNRKRHDKEP